MERALLFRTISTGTGVGKKGSVYSVPQNPDEAIYSRDALAKTLYSRCVRAVCVWYFRVFVCCMCVFSRVCINHAVLFALLCAALTAALIHSLCPQHV